MLKSILKEIQYPIRVLVLDTIMDCGGAEVMIMNYYRCINRKLVQFDFLVHREEKGFFEDEIKSLGGRIFRICPPYPQNYLEYKYRFSNFLDKHPEIKIIHDNMAETGLFALKIAKKKGIPVRIYHSHTAPTKVEISAKNIISRFYNKLIKKYVNYKFACGHQAAIYAFGKKKIDDVFYVKNSIDTNIYKYDENIRNEIRKDLGLNNKFVVGHVGRFYEVKNHSFLIDIFYEIHKKNNDAVLLLVGGIGGTDSIVYNRIVKKVKHLGLENYVIFTGIRNDVYKLLQAMDAFVLPSFREGFPVVMVEAQTAGLNCCISDRVPKECVLTDNVDIMSLSDDESLWANKILEYKNKDRDDNHYKIKKIGFDINDSSKKLQQFYIDALNNYKD